MSPQGAAKQLLVDNISRAQFDAALALYPECIERISEEKGKKNAGKAAGLSLKDLDLSRFETLPEKYKISGDGEVNGLDKDDVVQLVEWKLKHGTFRPGLLAMAQNNNSDLVKSTTQKAFQQYRSDQTTATNSPTKAALKELCTIKGTGPATASLLLSVHDPDHVPFFSDEVFIWLWKGGDMGRKKEIKYSASEYGLLEEKAKELRKRLDVSALEVEKVAFVLGREDWQMVIESAKKGEEIKDEEGVKSKKGSESEKSESKRGAGKRKALEPVAGSRTSSRAKRQRE